MKVIIEDHLQEYMRTHNHKVITLRMKYVSSSSEPLRNQPTFRYSPPKHPENFNEYQIGDIQVFIEKDIEPIGDVINLSDTKVAGFHKCLVSGVKYEAPRTFTHL